MRRSLLVLVLAQAACRGSDPPPPQPRPAPPAPRRVLGPAPGGVRPMPPHAIRADGVGPYRLGRPLGEILADLPLGPSIATLDIPGVVGTSVVRAEDGAVLIDGESQGEASFLAVVRPDIARTESGIMVGSSRDALDTALGPAVQDRRRARDPRLWIGKKLPGVRFLVEQDRVAAMMIARGAAPAAGAKPATPPPEARDAGDAAPTTCDAPLVAEAMVIVAPKPTGPMSAAPWCAGDGAAVTAVAADGAITLVTNLDGKPRKAGSFDAPGVAYVAPIADDDRDDLAVVSERAGTDARTFALTIYRWEAGRPVKVADQDLYRLTASSARWIGAKLEDVELLVELEVRDDDVVASGVMVSRAGGEIHDVAPLVPVEVTRRRRTAAAELDAGHAPSSPSTAPDAADDAHR